ncbi:MAG: hypothetical protein IT433_05470 [Phycisphaerales bacterium]|nr:hypothetical protein [Phycisphaerales bacterium]
MALKTSTGLAASALLSLAGSSALAQFESRWAGAGDFAYHAVDALSVGATSSRLLVAAGSAVQAGTPSSLDLSFWGTSGWQDFFGHTLWRLQGAGSWIQPTQIQQLPGGDYLVTARGSDPANGDGAILMRFNSNLGHVWNYSHRDNDPTRGKPFALPLASGKVLMVSPSLGSVGSRVVACDQTGPTGFWTKVYADTLGADLLFTDGVELPGGVVLLIGTYRPASTFSSEGCILAIDPATSGTPLGLWTYAEPGFQMSDFRAAALDPAGSSLFVSGALTNLGFPSFTTNAWAVRIFVGPFSAMAPQAAAWYITDFVPADRGMAYRPGSPAELAIAGSHHDSSVAKSARVNTTTLGNLRLEKFGRGLPPYTAFTAGTLDPAGNQVMVGAYRPTFSSVVQGYVVATNAAGATMCSEPIPAIADSAGVVFTVRTPVVVPPASPFAAFQRGVAQEAVNVQLPAGPYCGDRLCTPDYNEDGNVDQDDVLYLLNVIGGGENPTGADPDFNQDGNLDQDDVSSLISVVAGGDCP